jgi:hypothetical protein
MLNFSLGAGAASRYGSDSTKMMLLRLRNTGFNVKNSKILLHKKI